MVQPGELTESCGNNIDDDCDGQIDEGCMGGTCDPLIQNCVSGEACTIGQDGDGNYFSACVPAGNRGVGNSCNQTTTCVAGALCVGGGGVETICAQICALDIGASSCPSGTQCVEIGLEDTPFENVGVCG